MDEQRIEVGMKVKVLTEGKFKDQVVKVVAIHRKRKTDYQLATTWEGKFYPTWFYRQEIEIINEDKQ